MSDRGGNAIRLLLGVALLAVGFGLGWLAFSSGAAERVGDVEAMESTLTPPTNEAGPVAPTTAPEDLQGPALWPSGPGTFPGDTKSTASPTRLIIESIGVAAPVKGFGVDPATGQMEVPYNVDEVAWYRYGPSPGQPGSAVMAAHVDLAGRGPGVFFELRDLEPGARIVVEYEDGSEMVFMVEARAVYEKEDLPLEAIFRRSGMPVLTLITCGGGFNSSARSYDSNVVVYAVPVADFVDPVGPQA